MTQNDLIKLCKNIMISNSYNQSQKQEHVKELLYEVESNYSKKKAEKVIKRIKKLGVDTIEVELWNNLRD